MIKNFSISKTILELLKKINIATNSEFSKLISNAKIVVNFPQTSKTGKQHSQHSPS